jgi:O-antigen/teichoic acid export membrane protein
VVVIGAPLILAVFGPAYAEEELLLRLLATSVIPFAVINLYVSLARVRTQPGRIVLVQGAVASVLLVAVLWLLPRAGLDGVGWAFLGTYGTAAIVLLATALRPLLTLPGIRPASR